MIKSSIHDLNQQLPNHNKFAITQLKFKNESYQIGNAKSKDAFTPCSSLQNWSKTLVVRTQRKKKSQIRSQNEHFGLLQMRGTQPKNNMFMAWKDRNNQQSKNQSNSSRFFKQVMTSMRKSISERKLQEIPYDLQSRRLTAIPKHRDSVLYNEIRNPIDIMVHKLQCEDKCIRRINPTAHLRHTDRFKIQKYGRDKSILIKLTGWDGDNGQMQFERDILP